MRNSLYARSPARCNSALHVFLIYQSIRVCRPNIPVEKYLLVSSCCGGLFRISVNFKLDCGWLEDGEFSQWFCLEQALYQRCILAMRFFRHLDGLDAFRDGSVEAYTPYKESMVLDAEGILSSQESLGTAPVQQVPPNLCLEHSDF